MRDKIQKLKYFIRKNIKWIILLICIIGFLSIAEDAFSREIMKADIVGYEIISTYLISDFVTPIAKIITNFGGAFCLISIAIIALLLVKNKKIGLAISFNLIIITALNILVKNIVQRPRPTEYRLINESGYSFPSGHSMVSMAFYGFLIYLVYRYIKNSKIRYTLMTILTILIITIGTSRIYLGVHYTSDVIAGFLISISYLILFISIINKYVLERGEK